MSRIEKILEVERMDEIINVFGSFDENLKIIEAHYDVSIASRSRLKVEGKSLKLTGRLR